MPTPSAGFRSGKNGRAVLNGTTVIRVTQWTVDLNAEAIDFANSVGRGFGVYLPGIRDLEFELFFDYYVTDTPFNQANIGAYITNVNLTIGNPSDGCFWGIPVALVTSGSCTSPVRGKVSGVIRGKSSGGYIQPVF